jgi:hypothetical protein
LIYSTHQIKVLYNLPVILTFGKPNFSGVLSHGNWLKMKRMRHNHFKQQFSIQMITYIYIYIYILSQSKHNWKKNRATLIFIEEIKFY